MKDWSSGLKGAISDRVRSSADLYSMHSLRLVSVFILILQTRNWNRMQCQIQLLISMIGATSHTL